MQLRTKTLNGKWFDAYTTLAAVNACLWHAEDDLRETRTSATGYMDRVLSVAQLAFRIQALNDQRAACVRAINQETGEAEGAEKLSARSAIGAEGKEN